MTVQPASSSHAVHDEAAGFRRHGTHASRSAMVNDLRLLLDAVSLEAPRESYRRAIVEDNVLGKRTLSTRKHTMQSLSELFALDPGVPLFYGLRVLAAADPNALPVLALLCALGRDELLRASAPYVLGLSPGASFFQADLDAHLEAAFPERFTVDARLQVAQITASSWTQSGHLEGRVKKVRRAVDARPATLAYALLLGHLSGKRGHDLMTSEWALVFDVVPSALLARLDDVVRPGWFQMRRAGDVLDLSPAPALVAPSTADLPLFHGPD